MDDISADAPDWEILKLLREVRRRIRSGDPQRFLARLSEEPRWVTALPPEEAKVARTMLDATRELARRAVEAKAAPAHPMAGGFAASAGQALTEVPETAPLPRRTKAQERRNLALARQADALAAATEAAPEGVPVKSPRRRRR